MSSNPFPQTSALQKYLQSHGRFPPVTLQLKPIDPSRPSVEITTFLSYSFQSSILVPVDSFSFTMVNPTLPGSLLSFIRDGDIAILKANGTVIGTGIIDTVSIGTDRDSGEVVEIHGRNLIGQLEDQSTVNDSDDPIWGNALPVDSVVNALIASTRIGFYRLQETPAGSFLFATEPGESKMSALLRYLEPLNCVVWMDGDGALVVGRPNMGQQSVGTLIMDRTNRNSNCMAIKAVYSSTQIPNIVIPVWTGQESVQSRVSPEQAIANNAIGPSTLRKFDHKVPKTVVVSTPSGADPQSLSQANQITVAGSNILQAYAKRELARANVHEIGVQVNVKGHYNDALEPFQTDTCYNIKYPRAGISSEDMYLHTVEYTMDRTKGQFTSLFFCRKGCIVADIPINPATSTTRQAGT